MTPPKTTWPQVLAWRLRRQSIEPPGAGAVVDVVRALAGVQAQVASAADLAVSVRQVAPMPRATTAALEKDRTLVKTWAMRGTLHLLEAQEAPDYLALIGAARTWERPAWQRASGTTPADLEAIATAARDVLGDGRAVPRDELVAAIVSATGSHHLAEALASGWGGLLKPLAYWGMLCHGPTRGNRVSFALPEAWVPGWRGMPAPDAAAPRVIRRYLGAHGPATPDIFNAWLSRGLIRRSDPRRWFESMGEELAVVDVEGSRMQALAADVDELIEQSPSEAVHLLPGFDQYILAAGTGAPYLVPPTRRADVSRTAGWISAVVIYQGRVAGTWTGTGADLIPALFEDVPRGALDDAIERMRRLLARVGS